MSSGNVLSEKDRNTPVQAQQQEDGKPEVKSMEYHRQVLQSKMEEKQGREYVSPSDNIMSPCTAKLNALRGKQVTKAKPKSLFAQASAKKFVGAGENVLGARKPAAHAPSPLENSSRAT